MYRNSTNFTVLTDFCERRFKVNSNIRIWCRPRLSSPAQKRPLKINRTDRLSAQFCANNKKGLCSSQLPLQTVLVCRTGLDHLRLDSCTSNRSTISPRKTHSEENDVATAGSPWAWKNIEQEQRRPRGLRKRIHTSAENPENTKRIKTTLNNEERERRLYRT